jgi:hypothetical protein
MPDQKSNLKPNSHQAVVAVERPTGRAAIEPTTTVIGTLSRLVVLLARTAVSEHAGTRERPCASQSTDRKV